ncbi:cyclic nucleotide-gated ion channel 1 [Quercus suber]|uniref:Cyclic nucleotide-gated ion channel 1 n=1 Tax=Quercus suber TaxID=58331 RepID=A0AAW0L3P4_QUESU
MRSTRPSEIIKSLNTLVLFQYVPRIRQIYLSWKNLPRNAGKLDGWIKALFNFFLFILASHFFRSRPSNKQLSLGKLLFNFYLYLGLDAIFIFP